MEYLIIKFFSYLKKIHLHFSSYFNKFSILFLFNSFFIVILYVVTFFRQLNTQKIKYPIRSNRLRTAQH
jgi:hypothetical protein